MLGSPITVKQGEKRYITVFNGVEKGQMYYEVEFSGASSLVAGTTALAAFAFSTLYWNKLRDYYI
mgnify:CR=1 FL=1